MNTKHFRAGIDEVTTHEHRRYAEPSITDSSISESSPKKFGFGKKCLIVFAAALIASAIIQQLLGASAYTQLDKAFGVDPTLRDTLPAEAARILGGATGFFLMAMVIAAFVRGSTGAITGVVLVGVCAYFSGYGMLHNRQPRSRGAVTTNTTEKATGAKPTARPLPNQKQSPESFPWKPTGSEYSVVFAGTPKISEARGVGDSGERTVLQATYSGTVGFERAEFMRLSETDHVTKETENTAIANWARATGVEYYQVQFNNSKTNDIVTTFKGTKRISTDGGDVTMSIIGERHCGEHSMISLMICAPASKNPTPEGMAFLESVRLER
jgi:hypothetical protein